jgi:hypothetical protein
MQNDIKVWLFDILQSIEEWQILKAKYVELQKEEVEKLMELAPWQNRLLINGSVIITRILKMS